MLDDAIVRRVLSAALARGGERAEIYAEDKLSHRLWLEDGRVEELVTGRDRGAGVRVVRGAACAYAFTDGLDGAGLLEAAKTAAAVLDDHPRTQVCDLTRRQPDVTHPVGTRPVDVHQDTLADVVWRAEDAARAHHPDIIQVTVAYRGELQEVFVANSEGFTTSEERNRTFLMAKTVARRDGVVQTGFDSVGRVQGFELLEEFPPEEVARRAAGRAVAMLAAKPAPAKEMPVVMAAGTGGVLFHESCGHGMEADDVGRHASVYRGRQGQRIGVPEFNGTDDATVAGGWGSFQFDDEGTPAQRTVLFDGGVCTDYLTDLIRARQLGTAPSGNGRRESYRTPPQPRMTNTYILPGADDPGEIIAQTPEGLYVADIGGGEVDPVTGKFVFGVDEGYLIENGTVTTPVRGANLIGDSLGIIAALDALGRDFAAKPSFCGKYGQWVPVDRGAPTLRITRITVGGTEDAA